MKQYLILLSVFLALVLSGCTSTPTKPSLEDEVYVPNWETHANDATVLNSHFVDTTTATPTADERALEIQQFATINYRSLGQELKSGEGKNLSELMRILRIHGGPNRAAAVRRVKSLFEGSTDPSQFAEDLWRWYQSEMANQLN